MKQKNNLLSYFIVGSIGLGMGYIGGKSNTANNYTINSDSISYKGNYERSINIESERIIVGSLKERISDLLLESPGRIKVVTEDLLREGNYKQ